MKLSLQRFDPEFTTRRLSDYPPYMWRPGCTPAPDCERSLYRIQPREAPFAVIGDFSGDGVLDVVMDGDNRRSGRRVVILSAQRSFTTSEVESLPRISDEIMASRSNNGITRGWEDGLDVGLTRAKPGRYRSPYERERLELTTDGFVVSWFEKAAMLYYFRNGRWNTFTLSD
jgi:hypothetical protein